MIVEYLQHMLVLIPATLSLGVLICAAPASASALALSAAVSAICAAASLACTASASSWADSSRACCRLVSFAASTASFSS